MNARLLFPIAAFALALAGVGCKKSSESNRLNNPTSSSPPAGPVELKLKWTPGERVVEEFDIDQTMLMNSPDRPAPVSRHVTMGQKYSLTVVKAKPNGGHELEVELLGARVKMEVDGRNYDSDGDSTFGKILSKLVGCKIKYFLDASNNVEYVGGIDEVINQVSDGGPMTGVLRVMFNEDKFKQLMIFNQFLPQYPVQPGDTWSAKIQFPEGASGTYYMAFREWKMSGKRNCARIEMSGDIKSERAEPVVALWGVTSTIPAGTVSGTFWFDPELGTIISSKMNLDATLLATSPGSFRPGMGTTPPQIMTNQVNQVIDFKVDSLE